MLKSTSECPVQQVKKTSAERILAETNLDHFDQKMLSQFHVRYTDTLAGTSFNTRIQLKLLTTS